MALRADSPSIVQDALTMFNHARDKRRPLLSKWTANYHVVHNRTWGQARPVGHPRTEIPEIYPILASIVAWETDSSPRFSISPSVPPNTPYAEYYTDLATDLEWIMDTNWDAEDYDAEVQQTLMDGEVYGIGYGKVCWEPLLHGGLGNVTLRRVDPFNVYLDPDARSWRDVSYIFETRTVSRDELRRRFPDANTEDTTFRIGDAPSAPTQIDGFTSNPGATRPNPVMLTPGNVTTLGGGGRGTPQVNEDTVTLVELWYRTTTKSELPPSPEADPTPPHSEWKDEWRCLTFAGQQVLLHESAEDIYGHGRHPYARYVPLEEGELYGYSLVEQLAPLQIAVNRLTAAIEHNAWLSGNPIMVKKDTGGRQTMTNRPGEAIETADPNQDIRWLQPPPLQQQHMDIIKMMIGEMERISGMSGVVRGYQPAGRNTESTMDSIQDSAFVRVRLRLRNFERFLRDLGWMACSVISEFYDQARIMTRVGPDGSKLALALGKQHFYVPGKDDAMEPMQFNLSVSAGASEAIGRASRDAKYERLFALGAVDVPFILEQAEIPNYKEVAERVMAAQQAAGTVGMPPTQRAAARR